MKNILVPTDFSSCSNAASDMALALARQAKAEIHFMHIMVTPVAWAQLPKQKEKNFPETVKAIGRARGSLLALEERARKAGLRAEHFLVFDETNDEILRHLKHYHHDFIVMGSHGKKGVRDVLLGSNARKMMRHARSPVLVVKRPVKEFKVRDVVFASDFGKESEKALSAALDLIKLTGAKLHLVFVNTPGLFEESHVTIPRMKRLAAACPKDAVLAIVNARRVQRGIDMYTAEVNAGLIIMCTSGRGGVKRMLQPSVAEAVARSSDIPVLIVKVK